MTGQISSRRKTCLCFLHYTLLFLLASFFVFFYFIRLNKSFVWNYDGLYQHYNSLLYWGNYLRNMLRDIPLWDMSIGYGSDILTTLSYYAIGDPLALLAGLVPASMMEYLYAFLVILRLYLAGLAFLLYARSHQNNNWPSILGALTYCFSGFAIFACARHPYFINPMIYFPLILMGIDKIFAGKKPVLFILITALSAISNYYFFYMICILMFIYALFRYFSLARGNKFKGIFPWLLRFIGYFSIGVGLSMFILLPTAAYLLNTNRMSASYYVPSLYPVSYYAKFLTDFFCADLLMANGRYYTVLGFVPLILLSVFVLFLQRKKYTDLKIGFLLLSGFLMVPFFAHVMNGFSYVTNRWIWGYGMLLSYIMVKMLPEILRLSKKKKMFLLALVLCYVGVCLFLPKTNRLHCWIGLIMLLLLCLLALFSHISLVAKTAPVWLGFLTVTGICINGYFLYSPAETNYIEMFRDQGSPTKLLTTGSQGHLITEIEDDSNFFRYDQYGVVARENTAMQNGLYSTDFYFSVANGNISRFFTELSVATEAEHMYNDLDSRTILDYLASVKYFIVRNGEEHFLPYSYDTKVASNKKFSVYSSQNSLPLGYTYENFISKDTYDSLTPVEKQQALLQGVVLENSTLPQVSPEFNHVSPEMTIHVDENIVREDDHFIVSKKDAQITIDFDGAENSETYLVLNGLSYEGDPNKTSLQVSCGNSHKKVTLYTPKNSFYSGKEDFLCNIGYQEDAPKQITLTFRHVGVYTIDDLYVSCQPMTEVNQQAAALREDVLEQVEISGDRITGAIDLTTPKSLVLSIPYTTGWTAYVNGEKQNLQQANTMYMALELTAGHHEIELRYRTPYLNIGLFLSFISLILLIIITFAFPHKKLPSLPGDSH